MATTPEKPPNTPSGSHRRLLADTWFLEIGSLLLGIGAFVIMIVLLAHYDGKQQFQWNGVTLNAVVAVLATVARIGIVVPVAEALAQWKWMHFSKGYKPLSDFGILDDASRGTRGNNKDPNQYYVDQSPPVLMTTRSNVSPSQSIPFKNATTLLWSAAILPVPNSFSRIDGYAQWIDPAAQNVQATECALYLCIKEYTSQMLNGQILESFTDVASTRNADSWQVHFNTDGDVEDTTGHVYSDGVSGAVDALYTNKTYLPRAAFSMSVPANSTSIDSIN